MSGLLNNDLVELRALEPTDLDVLYRWENDSDVWTVSGTLTPYSRQAIWKYLEDNVNNDIYSAGELRLMAMLKPTQEPIGTVDLFHFDPVNNRAELGLLVSPAHRGNGYARVMLDLLCEYACGHLGLRQLYAIITADNEHCLRLFDQYGFSRSGTLKAWVRQGRVYTDAVIFQHVF